MFKIKTMAAFLLLIAVSMLAAAPAKYVFLFVGDGMGPEVRKYYQKNYTESSLEKFPVSVMTGTNNAAGQVTDSAASGTAIACGIKTYNGSIGMDKNHTPVTSLAKIFRDKGYSVGIITSVGLNDATPGAHYANRNQRSEHAGVMSDIFASNFDFFAGDRLLMPPEYSIKNFAALLKQVKYEFRDKYEFDEKTPSKRVVFVSPMTVSWPAQAHDRHYLKEVTAFAADRLSANPKGFFMLVEGGAIDHCNHGNDIAGSMREMRDFDLAVQAALDFAAKHPDETLIVITSDHDTGGLNLDDISKTPIWQKQPLLAVKIESEFKKMFKAGAKDAELIDFLARRFALDNLTAEEREVMQKALDIQRDPEAAKKVNFRSMYGSYNPVVIQTMRLRDKRCGLSWSSFSHTNRKVITNAKGAGEEFFREVKENSDIAGAISQAAFGKNVMPQANKTMPYLVEKRYEEYFNFITVGVKRLVFRYGQKNTDKLIFTLKADGKVVQEHSVKDRAGRIYLENLAPATDYTMAVERNGKVIVERKVSTLAQPEGKLLCRMGLVADAHVSLKPDARYGRMHSMSAPVLNNILGNLAQAKAEFIVMPGDVTDASTPGEIKAVAKLVKKFKDMPFYAVPGNHDYMNRQKFADDWQKTFGKSARLEKYKNIQILLLDTYNGKLADKEDNLKAIAALDPAKPVIVISHYQLTPDDFINDDDKCIHDREKAAKELEKLSAMNGIILVGHKNIATSAKLGKMAQVNLPQMTQFPAGYIYAEVYTTGVRMEFRTGMVRFYDEYSRIRCTAMGMGIKQRDQNSLKVWNAFYPADFSAAE